MVSVLAEVIALEAVLELGKVAEIELQKVLQWVEAIVLEAVLV
jgi:hypothetical protein